MLGKTEKDELRGEGGGGGGEEITTLGLDPSLIPEQRMKPELQKVLREVRGCFVGVRYFSKSVFPRAIFQVTISQMYIFPRATSKRLG